MKIRIYANPDIFSATPIDVEAIGAKVNRVLNGQDQISFKVISESKLYLTLGATISHRIGMNLRWYMNHLPTYTKKSNDHHEYDFVFQAPIFDFEKVLFENVDETKEFFFNGRASDFIDLIIDNLDAAGSDIPSSWVAGACDSTDYKNLQFDNQNCLEALNLVADAFDLEYQVGISVADYSIGLVDTVGNATGITLGYGQDEELYSLKRINVDESELVTRLYYLGSDRNLPSDYGHSRLQGSVPYIENNISAYGVREGIKIFDEIKPQYEGSVTSFSINEKNQNVMVDSSFPFDLLEKDSEGNTVYLISGTTAKINFLTGDCAGYTFDVLDYDHITKTIKFITFKEENGYRVPNNTIHPSSSDTYVMYDILMPDSYAAIATLDLDDAAAIELDKVSSARVAYELRANKKFFAENSYILNIGDEVAISAADLGTTVYTRVIELTFPLYDQNDQTLKLSDVRFVVPSRSKRIAAKNVEIALTVSKLGEVENLLKSAKTTNELKNRVYNVDDEFFIPENNKLESLDPYMLALDSGEPQWVMDSAITNPTSNVVEISPGTFTSRNYNAKNRIEIEKLLAKGEIYEPNQEWIITGNTVGLTADVGYYLYAKVDNTKDEDGVLTGTNATLYADEEVITNKNTTDNFLYFMLGRIEADRTIGLLWGGTHKPVSINPDDWSTDFLSIDDDQVLSIVNLDALGKVGWDLNEAYNIEINVDEVAREVTLIPDASGEYHYYASDTEYIKTGGSVTFDDITGAWFIYYNEGTLVASQTPWTITTEAQAFVCTFYWNAIEGSVIGGIQPEFHSWEMAPATHDYLHHTIGTRYDTGLSLSLVGSTQIDLTGGSIYDEDIKITITDQDIPAGVWEQPLTPMASNILYRTGVSLWNEAAVSNIPVIIDGNRVQYNELSGGIYSLSDVPLNDFCAYWIIATGYTEDPIIIIPGQEVNNTLAEARDGNSIYDMNFGALPTPEHKVIWRVIVKSINNSPYYELEETKDYRKQTDDLGGEGSSPSVHGNLSGLLAYDHPQYFGLSLDNIATGNNTFEGLNEFTLPLLVESLQLDLNYTHTPVTGEIFWNATEKTASLQLEDGGSFEIGQELGDYYKNLSGGTMVAGDVVSGIGANGNQLAMSLTNATTGQSASACLGMVTVPSINNNQPGRITKTGKVRQLNTSAFTEGLPVYVDPLNPGKLTQTAPNAPSYFIHVGIVLVSHSTEGVIEVNIRVAPTIESLSDVNGTPLTTTGQILVWDETSQYFDFNYNINDFESFWIEETEGEHYYISTQIAEVKGREVYTDFGFKFTSDLDLLNKWEILAHLDGSNVLDRLSFNYSDSEFLSISKDGKVGVGLINPDYNIDVLGDIKATEYCLFSGGAGSSLNTNTRYGYLTPETTGIRGAIFGSYAAYSMLTKSNFTAIGAYAAYSNSGGASWTAIGSEAARSSTYGSYWTAIGQGAAYSSTSALNFVAIGQNSGYANTTGGGWVAIGRLSGLNNINRSYWVTLGYNAGSLLADGSPATRFSNSVYVGANTKVSAYNVTNENVFGYSAIGSGSNTVTLGDSNITDVYTFGQVTHAAPTLSTHSALLSDVENLTSSLTQSYLPVMGASGFENSAIYQEGISIGIGTTTPQTDGYLFEVTGGNVRFDAISIKGTQSGFDTFGICYSDGLWVNEVLVVDNSHRAYLDEISLNGKGSGNPLSITNGLTQVFTVDYLGAATATGLTINGSTPYSFPTTAGTTGQILKLNASNVLEFVDENGGASLWTDATTHIYRDGTVCIGKTTATSPTTVKFQVEGASYFSDTINIADNADIDSDGHASFNHLTVIGGFQVNTVGEVTGKSLLIEDDGTALIDSYGGGNFSALIIGYGEDFSTVTASIDDNGDADFNSLLIGGSTVIDSMGYIKPITSTDAAAPNDSVYNSSDAGKLVYKDPSGTVNNLY